MAASSKYAGRETYGDPDALSTGVAEDLKAIGSSKGAIADFKTLIEVATTKGEPIDDKKMMVKLKEQTIWTPV